MTGTVSIEETTQQWNLPSCDIKIRSDKTEYGLGIFACEDIPSGTDLGPVLGTVIDDSDYQSDYCMEMGGSLSLEPDAPFRLINHSCEPNCELYQIEYEDVEEEDLTLEELTISIETIKEIRAGEQLTIDYAWPAEEAIPCGCRAKSCRGYIVDPSEAEQARKLHGPTPTF